MDDDRTIWWWALGAFVLAAAGGAWWWWRAQTQPPPAPAAQAPAAEQPAPEPPPPQAAEHPIEASPAALASMGDAAPLPTLADSDSALRTAIASLIGDGALVEFFHMTGIAARFVATVDNLPRGRVATKILPVRGPGGAFVVDGEADARTIGAATRRATRRTCGLSRQSTPGAPPPCTCASIRCCSRPTASSAIRRGTSTTAWWR
jgi:hypothetical protein